MNWKTLHPVLHTSARYIMAIMFLMYAIAKILGTQFSTPPSVYDMPVRELSGFQLTWYYFGYSYLYGVFIASSQIITAFLLLFRKTTRIGVVLYLAIIGNIVVMDFAYGIDAAQGMAVFLTLLAIFVLLSEFQGFYQFFIEQPPLFQDSDRPKWMNKIQKAKYVVVPVLIIAMVVGGSFLKEQIFTKNEFYGAWQPDKSTGWDRIYFLEAQTYSIRTGCDLEEVHFGKYEFDREQQTIIFRDIPQDYLEGDIDMLNVDTSRTTIFLQGEYDFDKQQLSIRSSDVTMTMQKVR